MPLLTLNKIIPLSADPQVPQLLFELNDRIDRLNDWHRDAETEGSVLFIGPNGVREDNSNLYWDDTNNRLGIGTASPQRKLHILVSDTGGPAVIALDNTDSTDGNGTVLSGRATTTGVGGAAFTELVAIQLRAITHDHATRAGELRFFTANAAGVAEHMRIDKAGNILIGTDALATTATDEFLYLPSSAGAPTGTPTSYTGLVPCEIDTTNLRAYYYISGTWRYAALT